MSGLSKVTFISLRNPIMTLESLIRHRFTCFWASWYRENTSILRFHTTEVESLSWRRYIIGLFWTREIIFSTWIQFNLLNLLMTIFEIIWVLIFSFALCEIFSNLWILWRSCINSLNLSFSGLLGFLLFLLKLFFGVPVLIFLLRFGWLLHRFRLLFLCSKWLVSRICIRLHYHYFRLLRVSDDVLLRVRCCSVLCWRHL